ncbi:MAG: TonB-dependent receptor [Gammaproteobacteria bacterium]
MSRITSRATQTRFNIHHGFRFALLTSAVASLLLTTPTTYAQNDTLEEIEVRGIRGSLQNALQRKRNADSLIEVIQAEDIGKLPDQNLAEVLENVTGLQITREAGVGTGVQIRGTNANRTEINGVSTVGSGAGRDGIDFEDVAASIISSVEVIKAPEAKTIEGSVGGTINLKTIRPLDLQERIAAVRAQGEYSSLSEDGITPRLSGTYGDNWSTGSGAFGFVGSISYSEQDVTAFRPRSDRDNFIPSTEADNAVASSQSFDFLPIQFFVQDYDNYEYETLNFAGTLEWAPDDNMKFYFDTVINDQERRQESSRLQASGISGLRNTAVPGEFETVDFGSLDGQNLGTIQAAVRGQIPLDPDGSDGNLRTNTDTNSRLTDSKIFRIGGEWEVIDRLTVGAEWSMSDSDSTTPAFNTTLNFINPNTVNSTGGTKLDAAGLLANHRANEASGTESLYDSNENGSPFVYDLTGGSLAWGIAHDATGGPTTAQLLDPQNYVLRDVNINQDIAENSEDAFLFDFAYDLDQAGITIVDFGYRYNKTTSLRDQIRTNVGLREFADSPTGNLFADVIVAGPNNFDDADGRDLFIPDFLTIDPEQVASDPEGVRATLNAAILANNAITGSTRGPISEPTSSQSSFFDIKEKTHAIYGQANFDYGILRGNIGLRWVQTDISSIANIVRPDMVAQITAEASYDFVLPRINLAAEVHEGVIVRASWSKDIRRPDFDDLSSAFTFDTSPNPQVDLGNPALEPEEVSSFDLSAEWYFAPGAVASIGFFHKTRDGLFVRVNESPIEDPVTGYRDITDPCENGGIFNPIADINVFGPPGSGVGVCVPVAQTINGAGSTKQKGVEFAFQYDLAGFEDRLGWASGFGIIANLTLQDFTGSDEYYTPTSRADTVFTALGVPDARLQAPLLDLSETAYNITVYYEKYGISSRLRYTWREGYRSEDYGSTNSDPWGFPVIQESRGQLNASINYDVNDKLSVGVEAVNLTASDVTQSCVNEGALLCYQGLTDRRITFGASYRF